MTVPSFVQDFADRVGSTAVQAFAGSLSSVALLGAGDWKSAVVTAAGSAVFAAVKVLGTYAAQAKAAAPAVETKVVQVAQADEAAVVKAIGEKLKAAKV